MIRPICVFCNWTGLRGELMFVRGQLLKHGEECPNHPIRADRNRLRDELDRIRALLTRAADKRDAFEIERDRYLAALKAEAVRACSPSGVDCLGSLIVQLGALEFRVTRDPATGELVAEEVTT